MTTLAGAAWAAFDPRLAALVNRKEEDYASIVAKDLSINVAEVAGFPLAQVQIPTRVAPRGQRDHLGVDIDAKTAAEAASHRRKALSAASADVKDLVGGLQVPSHDLAVLPRNRCSERAHPGEVPADPRLNAGDQLVELGLGVTVFHRAKLTTARGRAKC